jgi:4-hydroxybenzoate polyprenyltransferase
VTTASAGTKTPDAEEGLIDSLPPPAQPYFRLMRADRPVGVWLLFLPCLWGVLIGRPEGFTTPQFWGLFVLFGIGAFVMRSAGCAYNDVVDKDVDARVARTAARPVASGAVSPKAAWALIVGLSLIGLLVLLQLGLPAILTGLGSLVLVAAYPFMKRITWWPQAWLGLTFNWGVLVGAAASGGAITLPALLLYAAGLFWTLGYDTIYACQDVEDDALVGVKSSARRLGAGVRPAVAAFYALCLALFATGLFLAGVREWLILLGLPAAHMAFQVLRLDHRDGRRCLGLFKSNVWTGALLALACLPA